jgi:hypothetical protein
MNSEPQSTEERGERECRTHRRGEKGKYQSGDVGVDVRIISGWILKQ